MKRLNYPEAVQDDKNRLLVGAAVGAQVTIWKGQKNFLMLELICW